MENSWNAINCEINIFVTWSEKCIILTGDFGANTNNHPKFEIIDTKLYVSVVTLSTQDNKKPLQQLKTGFKRTINWNKYKSEPTVKTQSWYSNHITDPSFQRVNILFVLSFENDLYWRSHKQYFLLTAKIKNCNVMIDE